MALEIIIGLVLGELTSNLFIDVEVRSLAKFSVSKKTASEESISQFLAKQERVSQSNRDTLSCFAFYVP